MSRRIYLRPEAEDEIREAAAWYDERGLELGTVFLDEIARTMGVLRASPERYPMVEAPIRKAVLRRFPYLMLFRDQEDVVVVISCFHTRRDPKEWRKRV